MCNWLIVIYLDMFVFFSNWVNYLKIGKKKELKVFLDLCRIFILLYIY